MVQLGLLVGVSSVALASDDISLSQGEFAIAVFFFALWGGGARLANRWDPQMHWMRRIGVMMTSVIAASFAALMAWGHVPLNVNLAGAIAAAYLGDMALVALVRAQVPGLRDLPTERESDNDGP